MLSLIYRKERVVAFGKRSRPAGGKAPGAGVRKRRTIRRSSGGADHGGGADHAGGADHGGADLEVDEADAAAEDLLADHDAVGYDEDEILEALVEALGVDHDAAPEEDAACDGEGAAEGPEGVGPVLFPPAARHPQQQRL